MNLFERQQSRILQIASSVRAGRSEAIGDGRAARRLLRDVAAELGEAAILIQVPRELDQSAYVPLMIARQCGAGPAREVAERLAQDPAAALRPLSDALSTRYLLIDGIDELRPPPMDWDVRKLFEPVAQPLRDWLRQHAAVITRPSIHAEHPREEPLPDRRWAADLLWQRVEHDPDRYTLAVARHLLLDPTDDIYALGWDMESLVLDLWQRIPSELRELIALLAAHRRPILREDLESLDLVSPAVIVTAIESFVVEHQRDQLWLPTPWYTMYASLEPDARPRHRRLADAFARRAREDRGRPDEPLAILEAHRHYALIPDLARARELARFGAGALLDGAVKQSKARRYREATETYRTVLDLADESRTAIDDKTRAYAIHYHHYNRHRANLATLEETLGGYEQSLRLWSENALFWSRLIHGLFLAREEDRALQEHSRAWQEVPPHPERERTLVVRTADRLLGDQLVLPALFIWGDQQSEVGSDQTVERRLFQRLAAGVTTDRLWAPGVPAVDLPEPVMLHVEETPVAPEFRCVAGDVATSGSTRAEAVKSAVRRLAFVALAEAWYRETAHRSVLSMRFKHAAYQRILTMGRDVVPDLLRWIERQPGHLHHALADLTGESPLPAGTPAGVAEVCAAWLVWGREHGYTW